MSEIYLKSKPKKNFQKILNFQKWEISKNGKFPKMGNFQKCEISKNSKYQKNANFQKCEISKNSKYQKNANFQKCEISKNAKFPKMENSIKIGNFKMWNFMNIIRNPKKYNIFLITFFSDILFSRFPKIFFWRIFAKKWENWNLKIIWMTGAEFFKNSQTSIQFQENFFRENSRFRNFCDFFAKFLEFYVF